jgi:hypothetical protein
MDEKFKEIVLEIQKHYRNKLKTDKEVFYHLLERIGYHIIKLTKLKESGNKEELNKEVSDMYLLALGLILLEDVDDEAIKKAADYYLDKIIGIYG